MQLECDGQRSAAMKPQMERAADQHGVLLNTFLNIGCIDRVRCHEDRLRTTIAELSVE